MKPSIQLQFNQNLILTPQLQQAIRLLQLSAIELEQEIQTTLESNVMLELDDDSSMNEVEVANDETEYKELDEAIANLSIDESVVDNGYMDDNYAQGSSNFQHDGYNEDFTAYTAHVETLQDYLKWQSNVTSFNERELIIADTIIDAINEYGYLTCSVEDILISLNDSTLTTVEVDSVLQRIQEFDPPGVGARNLPECLLLQLQQLPKTTPFLHEAITICNQHLHLLSSQNFAAIKTLLSITDKTFQSILSLLRSLHPFPGSTVVTTNSEYITPDVLVNRKLGTWHVELNSEIIPRLRINADYAKLIRRADRSADNLYLKNHLQEARWFIKNLANRNETLLQVATAIVELQKGFFEYGHEAMRPLVLRDVAEILNMHESTISRVTTKKYLHSPRGTFELKFFFSSYINTDDGGQCSATAIHAIIKKLIAAEQVNAPLSDDAIAKLLDKQGIRVARRTITKYREAMGIPTSVTRKRLA